MLAYSYSNTRCLLTSYMRRSQRSAAREATSGRARVDVRARRPFLRGAPVQHQLQVASHGFPFGADKPGPGAPPGPGVDPHHRLVPVVFRQRPVLSRGVVTVAGLALAAVVLLVDLHVAVQAERVDGDPAGDRLLVDAAAAGGQPVEVVGAGDADGLDAPGHFLEAVDSLVDSAATKASWGTSTRPTIFIRFLPSFCFSSSLRLRLMSPP